MDDAQARKLLRPNANGTIERRMSNYTLIWRGETAGNATYVYITGYVPAKVLLALGWYVVKKHGPKAFK